MTAMKKTIQILKLALLAFLLTAAAAAAGTTARQNQSPTPARGEYLRLVFIGALSGYVKPCG